jgi:hypothetical protein
MKKTFGNLKDNFLSRDQMKMIKGGMDEMLDDDSGDSKKDYKCCWTNDITNCSSCSKGTSCVTGATLKAC